ncbi:Uncharacterized protein ABJ98_0406 [Pseudomonas syringae pv. aceris]|nr:Uncharacterized protein ABJ98_0406 [Pseudomonas syringae pv. aceris]
MPQQRRQALVSDLDRRQSALAADADAQRQGVDEHAQRPVGTIAALHPAHQYGTEYHFFTARNPTCHLSPCQVRQTGSANSQLPRNTAYTAAQLAVEHLMHFLDTTAIALHVLYAVSQGRFVDVAEHVAEKRFVLGLADTQTRLGHMVAIRHRGRQLLDLPLQAGLHFLHHHFQRGVIQRQMVEQQHADQTLVGVVLGVGDAHQRRLADVQAIVTRVKTLAQSCQHVTVERIDGHFFQAQFRVAPYHLYRLFKPFPDHTGAQDVVAFYHALQGRGETGQALAIIEGEEHLQDVGVTFIRGQVVIENAFLQGGQSVDVLDVGQAARHARHNAINPCLIQISQRQHVRGNTLAALYDQVIRHLYFCVPAHRRGECGQGRLAEQHAHVSREVDLAHALDQFDGQQGMPAQLEEMIVAANLRHLQQRLPDLCDGDLDVALWRRVFAHCQRLSIRCRQRLLVELAVGGQREAVQGYKSTGHHVVGQGQQQLRTQVSRHDFVAGRSDHIGHQALVARLIFADQHQRFADRVAGGQHGLNFAQLDTETTDLHLVVVAAQVVETAIGHPATQVAGSVQARLRLLAERIRQETLGRQRFTVQVAPRNAGAADIQLADHTHRHRLAACIKYIQLQIGNAHTNRAHA